MSGGGRQAEGQGGQRRGGERDGGGRETIHVSSWWWVSGQMQGPAVKFGARAHADSAHHDHVQPPRRTAGRTVVEARFERATEPQPLKDRALALLTEGGEL